MLPHYLWRFKIQICDKLQASCLMKRHISCIQFGRQCYCQVYNSCSKYLPFTCSKMLTPSVNCIVNDALAHAVPSIQQTLLQFINAVQLRLMQSMLDVTSYLVIDRIKIGDILQRHNWRNKSGCWLLKKSHSFACPVCMCAVLLKDEEVAWHVTHHRQQLLQHEHVVQSQ